MRSFTTGLIALMSILMLHSAASAQLLKRLEQRLGDAVNKLAPPTDGAPTPAASPGYLGLTADETDGLQGVIVLGVKAASPAEAAGLKKDDLISAINGSEVKNLDDFQRALDQVGAGQRAQFTLQRGREALTLNATLVARQTPPVNRLGAEDPGPAPGGEDPLELPAGTPRGLGDSVLRPADDGGERASLGVSVVPVTEQTRAANGLQSTRGALVAAVRPGGPADRAGIPVGSVIVAIDGQRVNAAEDLVGVIAVSRPGQEVELSYYRGATLTRKTVRLSPTVLDARAMPAAPGPAVSSPPAIGGILGGAAGDRPLVRRVGEVLDNFARPAGGPPAGQMEDIATLKSQIELLQATVRSLEDRLLKLESKSAPAVEAAPDLPRDAIRGPELPLVPPALPALPTPPALP
ncbi:putative periplasmic serine endoprotease DegP-like precursor [Anatilimnocola aggregata]|uniref:Putative periplasmic serine endoprotease DegP-like n=1 Tax=Anatilimnocola aggregata TaxID=2528021 RepID=A0A517YHV9_9BACT|nr:PDZ domain-containing protein [Anatilimnocola aggregata]QDU29808.1 putative periplasmic serine endoprotease DegP-like precursor [Anatilimnocola aggregata]